MSTKILCDECDKVLDQDDNGECMAKGAVTVKEDGIIIILPDSGYVRIGDVDFCGLRCFEAYVRRIREAAIQ